MFGSEFISRFYSMLMVKKLRHPLLLLGAIAPVFLSAIFPAQAQTPAQQTQVCAYDPNSGRPNPLGMRAYITAVEQDGNTTFVYEQFPTPVGGGESPAVTIASRRELTFYNTTVAAARQLMVNNRSYYAELLGTGQAEGSMQASFAPVNDVLTCRLSDGSIAPNVNPTRNNVPIASLPNGTYRYWSGQPDQLPLSDEALLQRGGVLFLFRKTGNQIVGTYSYVDGQSACVQGQVSGNTVSGRVFPADLTINNTGNSFTPWGAAGFLQVRQGRRSGTQTYYNSAVLNLNRFNRINAGTQQPPSQCQ
jgi:hypothetical protein